MELIVTIEVEIVLYRQCTIWTFTAYYPRSRVRDVVHAWVILGHQCAQESIQRSRRIAFIATHVEGHGWVISGS